MIYDCTVVGGSLWSAVILCDLLLCHMSYLKFLLPKASMYPLWNLDHILGFGTRCPHPPQLSLFQARVWLLLVVLAMDALRSLLKPNMVLNQIYKCLGVLWKTHMQAALAKAESADVYAPVYVCLRGKAYKVREVESCVWNKRKNVCFLSVLSFVCVCVYVCGCSCSSSSSATAFQ